MTRQSPADTDTDTRASRRTRVGPAVEPDRFEVADALSQAEWQARAERIGTRVAPVLVDLVAELERAGESMFALDGLDTPAEGAADTPYGRCCAVLSTADGFNLCAVGVPEPAVGRLAAACASLYSVSLATADAIAPSPRKELDLVSLARGDVQVHAVAIDDPELGYLLLAVSAQSVSLGELLIAIRRASSQVRAVLR